jgi:hypothetical protein
MTDVATDPLGSDLLDAQSLARRLGVSREWVYDHAVELGAFRLGGGRRPRLRFDPRVVQEALEAGLGTAAPPRSANRFRRGPAAKGDVELLPIGGVRSSRASKRPT